MNWLDGIRFSSPYWLYTIPVLWAVSIAWVVYTQRPLSSLTQWLQHISALVYRHPIISRFPAEASSHPVQRARHYRSMLPYLLLSSLFACSLAQPYRLGQQLPEPPLQRDIVFLVDSSVTMVLSDYLIAGKRAQRIAVLKNVLSHFIERLKGNRLSLVVFSEHAYTLVPLTTDHALLRHQLQRIEPAFLTGRGSDLSSALLYAAQTFEHSGPNQGNKPVLVVLSDANRPARLINPEAAASFAAQSGFRIHTIAIGAGSYDAQDKQKNSLIYHPTDFELLTRVASSAGGQFFWAKDADSLSFALNAIGATEKRRVKSEPRYVKFTLYMWPLSAALIILLLMYLYAILSRQWL